MNALEIVWKGKIAALEAAASNGAMTPKQIKDEIADLGSKPLPDELRERLEKIKVK